MSGKPNSSPGIFDSEFPVLDGVRAASSLWVLVEHLPLAQGLLPGLLESIRMRGELGVEVFFAVSGFLVTRSLEQCRDLFPSGRVGAARDFVLRRIARIWPPYYITLLIFALAVFYFGNGAPNSDSGPHIAWSVPVFLANYTMPHLAGPAHAGNTLIRSFSIIWSVCFEEQFYLILVVLFLFAGKNYWKWMILLGALSVASRFAAVAMVPDLNYQDLHMMTHYRLDAIFWGCLAWIKRKQIGPWIARSRWIQAAIVASAVISSYLFPHVNPRNPLTVSIVFTATAPAFTLVILMLCYAQSPFRRILEWGPLTAVGRCSYEIYLIHTVIIWWVTRGTELNDLSRPLLITTLCVGAGWVFHFGLGKPARSRVLQAFRPITVP